MLFHTSFNPLRGLGLGLLSILLFSCAAAKISPAELENIRTLKAPEDKALVYIIRPTSAAAAITMRVTVDEQELGATTAKRFVYTTLKPGTRRIVSHAENKDELVLVAEAGKTYYIHQKVKMGIVMARTELSVMPQPEGISMLKKTTLAAKCPGCTGK